MRSKRFDGSDLRAVLVAMITNPVTCGRIAGQWIPEGLFDAAWANLIGGWCVKHFKKFGTCPGERIGKIFEMWAAGPNIDEKISDLVEKFLQALSDQHTEDPSEFTLDLAGNYFNKVRTEREMEAAKVELESGRVADAQLRLQRLSRVNLGIGGFVEAGVDLGAWEKAFTNERMRPLVTYNGDLAKFTEGAFLRGEFYCFLAPDKTGKTTHLVDFAYRATRQRNRVAYFDLGDSDEDEVLRRLGCRSSRRPEKESKLWLPQGWDENGLIRIETKTEEATALHAYREFKHVCAMDDAFRISCHRNSSASVHDVDSVLEDWSRTGWYPDVVCMDYADILAKPKGVSDPIQATDENWKALRRMSQERHCLIVTATQTKSTGYTKTDGLLGPEDFSGSKGKNAHINGMLGINVSDSDKEMALTRLNWVLRRKGYYNRKEYVWCAGCPAIGNPAIHTRKGISEGREGRYEKREETHGKKRGSGTKSDDGAKVSDLYGDLDSDLH